MKPGRFITFEGGEGTGKSTQVQALCERLQSQGLEVVRTREPGGTPRAERIRELLLEQSVEPMPQSCELLLMFAARATHLESLIRPALERGAWVICDRFTDASYAYQGGGRGMPLEHIAALENLVQGSLRPDITFLLDAPLDLTLERARSRNAERGGGDRFEAEQREFFEKVRAAYLARAKAEPQRFVLIDASAEVDAITAAIERIILQRWPQLAGSAGTRDGD